MYINIGLGNVSSKEKITILIVNSDIPLLSQFSSFLILNLLFKSLMLRSKLNNLVSYNQFMAKMMENNRIKNLEEHNINVD